jgi:sec-independent protein translocase protein TatA
MFGGKKLPELMKGIGQGIREFKDAKDGSTTTKDELPEKKN